MQNHHSSSATNIKHIFNTKETHRYKRGDIIMGGDHSLWAHIILEGFVKVYSLTEIGEENILLIYKEGDIFPLPMIFNNIRQEIYYEALTPVVVKRVDKDNFLNYFKENLDVAFYVTQQATGILNEFFQRIYTLELTNSYDRIISYLLFLAEVLGGKNKGKIVFGIPITQEDIANSVNITRETASKELNVLARKNLIYKKKSTIVINDIGDLEKEFVRHYQEKHTP
jgi:CRP-like cAMP-binding protein